ncbi:MAG TPA: hypothetical protein VGJ07_10830 [Rugosimonospora sp.]
MCAPSEIYCDCLPPIYAQPIPDDLQGAEVVGDRQGVVRVGDQADVSIGAYEIAVQRVLARTTWQKLVAGQTADDVYPEAVADTDRAFALLQTGTGDATDAGS